MAREAAQSAQKSMAGDGEAAKERGGEPALAPEAITNVTEEVRTLDTHALSLVFDLFKPRPPNVAGAVYLLSCGLPGTQLTTTITCQACLISECLWTPCQTAGQPDVKCR